MTVTSPPTIRQLPDQVANQIAAGEVIERPAAVIKELVENSLDAGADDVVIRIEDGGRRLIEVIDNGHGMGADDLPLALGRHATSKLRDADDLFRVDSLGFRGEALPSIAAVSEFELASHPTDADEGAILRITGGERLEHGPHAMPPGTRVTVRNLFWNVPVRLKFLKSQGTETGHVTDMVTRLALGHPHVRFLLEVDDRTGLELPPVDELQSRIRACFGRQMAKGLIAVDGHVDGTQLSGLIAHPSQARPTGKRQFVFLNGRHIRDKLLIAAIREGFKGFLEPRLHASVFLHLDMEPSLVDVNVHPTKSEVRFRRDKEVFHLIRTSLKEALTANVGAFGLLTDEDRLAAGKAAIKRRMVHNSTEAAPAVQTHKVDRPPEEPALQERFLPRQPEVSAPSPAPVTPTASAVPSPITAASSTPASPPPAATESGTETGTDVAKQIDDDTQTEHQVHDAGPSYTSQASQAVAPVQEVKPTTLADLPGVKRVVQLHDMYLLLETDQGIRIIDQHALHEKALWLSLGPEATDLLGGGKQELLVPKTIELSAAEIAAVADQLDELKAHGIEAEVFGPTTIALRAFPTVLSKLSWTAFFSDLASQAPGTDAIARLREAIGHRKACRAAVKAGDRLGEAEQLELVRLLLTMDQLEHCPHGRPTTLDLSWDELEKRFQR